MPVTSLFTQVNRCTGTDQAEFFVCSEWDVDFYDIGLDVSAVAKECRLDTFALIAVGSQGPVRIEYAATHPDVVTELVLCNGVAKVESS